MCVCVCVCESLHRVQLFAAPWTVTCQASLSMKFSRQEYRSGLPVPAPEKCNDGYYQILEKKMNRTQFDIKCSKFFMDPPLSIMKNKPQIRKWDLFNHQTISIPKETLNERDNLQNRKKDLQRKIPTRDSSPKHTISLCNLISIIHTTKNKMGQRLKWLFF